MAKYLFVYHGGGKGPTTPDEIKAVMDAWGAWFGSMGAAVVDGGNPVGLSSTVKPDGSLASGGGANPVSGYSLIEHRLITQGNLCLHTAIIGVHDIGKTRRGGRSADNEMVNLAHGRLLSLRGQSMRRRIEP